MRRVLILAAHCGALAACGDGGGTIAVPAANRPPVFTSAATASIAEGTNGVPYVATATDPDGDPLTFSIAGGADAAQFRLTAGGALTFLAIPRFSAPADADRNNSYLVELNVSDGRATALLLVTITVTPQSSSAFRVRRISSAFSSPLQLVAIPDGSGRVLVVQKGGLVRILAPSTGSIATTPFLDVSASISTDSERGLLGIALSPDFPTSGRVFTYLTNAAGNIEIRRFATFAANRDQVDPATGDVILTIPHPGFSNHNGGWIEFGPDGNLYLGTGDGGGAGDPNGNAQNTSSLLGKILRINPAIDAFPADPARDYSIPAANPFAGGGGAPEVWMTGLRNPFRAGFDRPTGNLYIGDVGQDAIEEIDLVPGNVNGLNFGWNRREGTQAYNGGANSSNFTPPVAEYYHGNGPQQGNSVTGGIVYRGAAASLTGQYVFGDFISGNIWSVPVERLVQGTTLAASAFNSQRAAFTPDAGAITNPVSFGSDQNGNLYIVDFDGEIFVVETI